jgi:hypothetical protein
MMNLAVAIDDGLPFIVELDRDFAIVQAERMTKRDELMRSFRSHDASDDCGYEDRPLRGVNISSGKTLRDICRKLDDCTCMRFAIARFFVADVDHCRPVLLINVA